jgi:hypothetical protein
MHGNHQPSRHIRLYNEGRQLLNRRNILATKAAEESRSEIMIACPFRPSTTPYRQNGQVQVPNGASEAVSRMRKAAASREEISRMLTPRVSIDIKNPAFNTDTQIETVSPGIRVEVMRDDNTRTSDCVNIGSFIIDGQTNLSSVVRNFGADYALTSEQTARLESKLSSSMKAMFGQKKR